MHMRIFNCEKFIPKDFGTKFIAKDFGATVKKNLENFPPPNMKFLNLDSGICLEVILARIYLVGHF